MTNNQPSALVHFGAPNTAAITAISPNDRARGPLMVLDSSTGVLWYFDASSSASASSTVLVPDVGDGRWLAQSTSLTSIGSTSNGAGASLVGVEDAGGLLTATNVETALVEILAKFATGLTPAISKIQIAAGTFASGEGTISTNIVVTASSYVIPIPTANVTGSTNFGCLANIRASNVAGAAGTGSILVRALGNDGAKDADAAGSFVALIIN